MPSHVSPWRLSSVLRLSVASSTCQTPATRSVLSTANFRVQACHWSKSLDCARENHDAPRSSHADPSLYGDAKLDNSRCTPGTLTSEAGATAEETISQRATDSALKTPKDNQSLSHPISDSHRSALLPFVQKTVTSGNLFNPLLANFIRQIESREERTTVVGQILPILHSLITRIGKDLDFARRRRPNRVDQLQKKYNKARTALHKVEALAQQLQVPITEIDEVTTLFHQSGEIENSGNWNVPGLQRSTRHMGEKEKEKAISAVLHALYAELSVYKKIGTKSNLKTAIDNLSSVRMWVASRQKRGSLGGVNLEPAKKPNRFTGLSYLSKTEEAEDLKRLQAALRQELSDSASKLPAHHKRPGKKDIKAHLQLQQTRDLMALQIYMISLDLERLQLDEFYQRQTERHVHRSERQDRDRQGSGLALEHDGSLLQDMPNVPHHVLHYIIDQVLHEIQLVMFEKGQQSFRAQMRLRSWHSAESVPVVDFSKVLKNSASERKAVDLCAEEFMALRVLRNAHAHQLCDSDVRQVRALISAICGLVKAIYPSRVENALLHNYRKLLIKYERLVVPELLRTRQAAREQYSRFEARHEAVQRRLDHYKMTAQGTKQSQRQSNEYFDRQKTLYRNRHYKRMKETATEQQVKERDIMLRLASSLQDFTYKMQVRRALRLLPNKRVPRLLQELQHEVSSGIGVLKTTDPSGQGDKKLPIQPEVSATISVPQEGPAEQNVQHPQ